MQMQLIINFHDSKSENLHLNDIIINKLFILIMKFVLEFHDDLGNSIIFSPPTVAYPRNLDLSNTDSFGLYGTRHFYVTYEDEDNKGKNVQLGAWHVLPNYIVHRFAKQLQVSDKIVQNITNDKLFDSKYLNNELDETKYKAVDSLLGDDFDIYEAEDKKRLFESTLRMTRGSVVLYLHGNTGSRGAVHRVELYKILRRLGHHVLTIDYRGYADSSNVAPTEDGVVRDALVAYKYLRNITNNPIYLYGHSLGTGVSAHLSAIIDRMEILGPKAVVLESPFNNIRDEIRFHPFSTVSFFYCLKNVESL
jgi:abhydrolase domain-containing protein 12